MSLQCLCRGPRHTCGFCTQACRSWCNLRFWCIREEAQHSGRICRKYASNSCNRRPLYKRHNDRSDKHHVSHFCNRYPMNSFRPPHTSTHHSEALRRLCNRCLQNRLHLQRTFRCHRPYHCRNLRWLCRRCKVLSGRFLFRDCRKHLYDNRCWFCSLQSRIFCFCRPD